MALRDVSLSEARRSLSALLREIESHPETGYQIRVRKRVVAELRSPTSTGRKNSGAILLKAARGMERQRPESEKLAGNVNSTNYKAFLYGDQPVTAPRSRK
jgi:hypothetical protein